MHNTMLGKQSIGCDVTSCRHHDSHSACKLQAITVCAIHDGGGGQPEDESMCGSYQQK